MFVLFSTSHEPFFQRVPVLFVLPQVHIWSLEVELLNDLWKQHNLNDHNCARDANPGTRDRCFCWSTLTNSSFLNLGRNKFHNCNPLCLGPGLSHHHWVILHKLNKWIGRALLLTLLNIMHNTDHVWMRQTENKLGKFSSDLLFISTNEHMWDKPFPFMILVRDYCFLLRSWFFPILDHSPSCIKSNCWKKSYFSHLLHGLVCTVCHSIKL